MHETERGSASRPALSRLIREPVEEFAETRWGRAPLLSRADELGAGFESLFSLAAADELVANRAVRTPFVRMAAEGVVLSPSRFTSSGGYGAEIGDQLDSAKVLTEFANGSTLVLQGLHKTWEPIARFTRELSRDLGAACQVNAYITPDASRGFDPHYDVHDVFVIQVHGAKTWTIHEPAYPDPLKNQPWSEHRRAVSERAAGEPFLRETFQSGDVLYLPRGWVHSAVASGGTSIHLTIGVSPSTRYAILERALAAVAANPAFRESLPLGGSGNLDEIVARTLGDAAREFESPALAGEVLTRIRASALATSAPEPVRPLATVESLGSLSKNTKVIWRTGLRATISSTADTVSITLGSKTLTLPVEAEEAVRALSCGDVQSAGALPGLDVESSIVVSRRLLREAVLRIP